MVHFTLFLSILIFLNYFQHIFHTEKGGLFKIHALAECEIVVEENSNL